MGFLTRPSVTQVNPNAPAVQPLQAGIAEFLMGQFQGGASPFASATSDLQRQASGGMANFLAQPSPEGRVLANLEGGLTGLANEGMAAGITQAALPLFETQLQRALGGAASAAPGRFSTAFASQGIDLGARAAQDFNLFQQQALQQDVQNRLGAANLLGTLAGQAGMNPFQRMLGAGQFGLAESQAAIDPQLRLMLAGMGFAQPQAMDTVVGSSPLDKLIQGGLAAFTASQFGGGG